MVLGAMPMCTAYFVWEDWWHRSGFAHAHDVKPEKRHSRITRTSIPLWVEQMIDGFDFVDSGPTNPGTHLLNTIRKPHLASLGAQSM